MTIVASANSSPQTDHEQPLHPAMRLSSEQRKRLDNLDSVGDALCTDVVYRGFNAKGDEIFLRHLNPELAL